MASKQEVTLSSPDIEQLALQVVHGSTSGLHFTNRANRDAVYKIARKLVGGSNLRRSSIRNQLLDPRYTVESRDMPDKGLGNDYRHFHAVLYNIETSRW